MTVIDLGGRRRRIAGETAAAGSRSRTLYQGVIALVEQLIVDQGLGPGDLLPTQPELAERAGVSMITVRRALDELERAGQVRRHQGVGTFVAHPKIVSTPTTAGGLSNTLGSPDTARLATDVLGLARVVPSADLAAALRRGAGDELWQVRRRRSLRGQPIILENALIPVELAPGLDTFPTERLGSLYDLLAREYGLEDDYEEQYLEVVTPDDDARRALKLAPRSQVMRIRGLSVNRDGVPFDCFEQIYPTSTFVFAMSGTTSRQLLSESVSRKWEVRTVAAARTTSSPRPPRVRATKKNADARPPGGRANVRG